MANTIPRFLIDRLGARRGTLLAAAMIFGIALADYATGYALRLSILHLVPIAIATWTASPARGYGAALLSCLLWLLSFQSAHFYAQPAFYFWEAAAMLCGFLAFAWLCGRLRDALQQADERFFRVLEEMHAAVYVADGRSGRIVYANPEMTRIYEGTAGGSAPAFERRMQGEGDLSQLNSAASADGPSAPFPPAPTESFASRTVRDAESGRWYLMQEGPIPWGTNPQIRLKVLTDITDQKQAERLRERNLQVMHQAAQLSVLAETASTLAHEINQPLMAIAAYTDACQRLLARPVPDLTEIGGVMKKCHGQAVRASAIIERLREFIRQRQHRPVPTDAKSLLAEAADILRPLLDDAGVSIELPKSFPLRVIAGDRVLLVQVLVNLMRNAIDAVAQQPAERRRVSVGIETGEPDSLVFTIADAGNGLADDAIEKIFVPFVTTKPEGLGLGLAICRSIAEAHGGRLWAANNPLGGATFYLSMPTHAS